MSPLGMRYRTKCTAVTTPEAASQPGLGTNLTLGPHPCDRSTSQRLHLQMPSHWGTGFSKRILGGDTNIQSRAVLL